MNGYLSRFLVILSFCFFSLIARAGQVAIIIDDIGYHLDNGLRAIAIPGALTLSVLPHTPNGAYLARVAHNSGKEVMLHAPMSTIRGHTLDPGLLSENMNHKHFVSTLQKNLAAIPYIQGVNNHMGSSLTQKAQPMNWLMAVLKKRGLYFVDSRTTPKSLALNTAEVFRVPHLKRNIFLDNQRDHQKITIQFQKLMKFAKRHGFAVGIGHPYSETLDVLEQQIPIMINQNVQLVKVSALINSPHPVVHKPRL